MPLGLHRYYSELQLSLFLAISACHCASSACGVKDETPRCNQRGSHPSRKTREGWGTRREIIVVITTIHWESKLHEPNRESSP
jgi:hypothetical protein